MDCLPDAANGGMTLRNLVALIATLNKARADNSMSPFFSPRSPECAEGACLV